MRHSSLFKVLIAISFCFFLIPNSNAQIRIKKFVHEFWVKVDPKAKEIRSVLKKIKKLDTKKPEQSDLLMVEELWVKTNKIAPEKWATYPKSYRLAKSLIFEKWFQLTFRFEGENEALIESFCVEDLRNWKEFNEEKKEIGDIYLLRKYKKDFGFDPNNIGPWADSVITVKAANCTIAGLCPAPFCREKKSKKVRGLIVFFKEALKLEPIENLSQDSAQVEIIWERFRSQERKGNLTHKQADLIYAMTKGMINDARYFHQTGAVSKYEKQQNITNIGCIAKVAWEDAIQEAEDLCNENMEINRCILSEYFPELHEDDLKTWLNFKFKAAYPGCRRDTCLNESALNSALELSDIYGHDDALCEYCLCTDTMYHEGYQAISRFNLEQLDSCPDSCKTLRVGCISKCAGDDYCETCTVQADEGCNNKICVCLDPSAVNYAHDSIFNINHPFYKKYFSLKDTVHNQDACTWIGCTDPCSPNFHPRAKEDGVCQEICGCTFSEARNYNPQATHEDSTCLFVRDVSLDTIKHNLVAFLEDEGADDGVLYLIKEHINLDYCGLNENCMNISLDIDGNVIKLASRMAHYDTGIYFHEVVDETMKALIKFFRYGDYADYFAKSNLKALIVGEADNQPIRKSGIRYVGEFGPIKEKYTSIHKKAPQTNLENIYALRVDRSNHPILLQAGSPIKKNVVLAFVRAYSIKLPIINFNANADVSIGAKRNSEEGEAYRKVFFQLEFKDFFKLLQMGGITEEASKAEIDYRKNFQSKTKCKCSEK